MISHERVKQLFTYDELTGTLTRKLATSNRVKVGQVVGYKTPQGYLQVRIGAKLYMVHRVIWFYMTGSWPNAETDHINGNRADNRWCNLREATKAQNMQNRHGPERGSYTGVLGVCLDKQTGKYRAQLTMNGRKLLNKLFSTIADAKAAYDFAKEKQHHF